MVDRPNRVDTARVRSAAVILAGGPRPAGITVLPRPLLPVGERAILDIVLRQLSSAGFLDVVITVAGRAPLVQAVFGDGAAHGLRIRYQLEHEPLALADTFLMMNGDVLTDLDHAVLLAAHRAAGSALTVATHERTVDVDYEIVHADGDAVTAYEAAPKLHHRVSMGVYAVEPAAMAHGTVADVPGLVRALIDAGEPVGQYLHAGRWLDIGRPDDYARAQQPELRAA
jgi:NDP-sugar pyrophosphorylase family protein